MEAGMAFREKVLWVSAAALLLVWGSYFGDLIAGLLARRIDAEASFGGFIRSVVLVVVIHVVASIVLAIASPKEANAAPDAREREINLSAYRPAYLVVAMLITLAMLATPVLVHAAPAMLEGAEPGMIVAVVIGNSMLLALVAGELVHAVWQIARYRRES